MSYCDIAPGHPFHGPYHDRSTASRSRDDDALFERLVLEINQAGLSWLTILKKRDALPRRVRGLRRSIAWRASPTHAASGCCNDAGIIRNRLKIDAAIENAKRIIALRKSHGSFAAWLDAHHPRTKDEWVKLFKKTFVFTGGEITGSFLLSIGYLPGAHDESCPVYKRGDSPWSASGAQRSSAYTRKISHRRAP